MKLDDVRALARNIARYPLLQEVRGGSSGVVPGALVEGGVEYRVLNAKSMGAWGHHAHLHHSGMRRDESRYKVGVRRGKRDI